MITASGSADACTREIAQIQHAEAGTCMSAPRRGGACAGVQAGSTFGKRPAPVAGDQCTMVGPHEGALCSMGVHVCRAGVSQRQRYRSRACRCSGPGLGFVRSHGVERTGPGAANVRPHRTIAAASLRSMQDIHALMKHALQLVHVWHLPPPSPSWSSEGGRWSHVTTIGRRRLAWRARHE